MSLTIAISKNPKTKADTAVVGIYQDKRLTPSAETLDRRHEGYISYHLEKQDKFKGKKGQFLTIAAPKDSDYTRFILAGYGDPAKLDRESAETLGGKLFLTLSAAGSENVHFFVEDDQARENMPADQLAAHSAMGLKLRSYKFDKYKSKNEDDDDNGDLALERFEIITDSETGTVNLFDELESVAEGVFLARNLVNEPPNELYPDSFARIIKEELQPLGVEVEIFDEKKMHKLGFHAALAVGMGSARPPRIVVMRWNGGGKTGKSAAAGQGPLAFVGKGVTFDTGGINIKPSAGMEDMKLDMAGAAAVVGLMKSLALRKAKADVVGIAGLAENMPSHIAYRPSDIISSLSGKTIEVMNTDAEGRLVLADCLTYVQRTYKPRLVVDLATLTGAMMVALGYDYCGTFVNNDELWQGLETASRESGEKLWRMPLDEVYKKDMVSKIADLRSLGGMGRYAGACTAAGFLEHFIEEGRPWAHLDIAGTAWIKADKPTCPKPGTGFGVRVLDRLVAAGYE